jgi:hypothetical protein
VLAVLCASETRLALEGFTRYLSSRIADQQHVIANLVTVNSEQRLGQTLFQLAQTTGKKNPRSNGVELRISHEELSEMVGTTRPRISFFMQRFCHLGLIEKNKNRIFVIKEKNSRIISPKFLRIQGRASRLSQQYICYSHRIDWPAQSLMVACGVRARRPLVI